MKDFICELGPIRPPSESFSLLVRISRNCPWNKCLFCSVYKQTRFLKRNEEDLIKEIDHLKDIFDSLKKDKPGMPGQNFDNYDKRRVALWANQKEMNVFLQDADPLIAKPHRIIKILRHLKDKFPEIKRINTYARSRTLAVKTSKQLEEIKKCGLSRIHVGIESGCDDVLKFMKKGTTSAFHLKGCKNVINAGIELCLYVMPGLGGKKHTKSHATQTAELLKDINPDFVRLRTLWVIPESPLNEIMQKGDFIPLEEDETAVEIRSMIKGMKGMRGRLVSDHDLNLFPELEGNLLDDTDEMIDLLDEFLALPPSFRDAFILGRRIGVIRNFDHFSACLREKNRSGYLTLPRFAGHIDINNLVEESVKVKEAGNGSLVKGMMLLLKNRIL